MADIASRAEAEPVRVLVATGRARVILPAFAGPSASTVTSRYRIVPTIARSAAALHGACRLSAPRLLLVDAELASALGARGLHQIRADLPDLRLLIVCTVAEASRLPLDVLRAVHGAVMPPDGQERLVRAFDTVLDGHLWFPRLVLELMIQAAAPESAVTGLHAGGDSAFDTSTLTPRETEAHTLMRQGLSNPEIADRMHVSINTVKKHLESVFRKLGLHKRRQTYE